MKEWLREGRVRFAVFVFLCNTEAISFVLKLFFGLSGLSLKIPICILAVSETIWWYYFSGWVLKRIKKTGAAREGFSIAKNAVSEVEDSRFLTRGEYWVKKYIIDPFNSAHNEKKIFWVLKFCGEYIGIALFFFLGLLPGMEAVGIPVLRLKKWNAGFAALIAGNLVKNIGLTTLLDFLWKFFK